MSHSVVEGEKHENQTPSHQGLSLISVGEVAGAWENMLCSKFTCVFPQFSVLYLFLMPFKTAFTVTTVYLHIVCFITCISHVIKKLCKYLNIGAVTEEYDQVIQPTLLVSRVPPLRTSVTSIFLNELFLRLALSSDLVLEAESLRKGNMGGMGTLSRGGHLPTETSRGLAEPTLPQRRLDCPA